MEPQRKFKLKTLIFNLVATAGLIVLTVLTVKNPPHSARRTIASAKDLNLVDQVTPEGLKKIGYYKYLDYWNSDVAKEIPEFEEKLESLIDVARAQEPEKAAVSLASIAMFMVNSGYGIKEGLIDSNRFKLSNIEERNQKVIKLLEEAHQLSKDQPLIRSWLEGHRVRMASGQGMDRIIELNSKDVVFNLFSSLILAQEFSVTEEQENQLFKSVELMTSPDSPCKHDNPKATCGATEFAPFAKQAASLMLGDAYLKQGMKYLNDRDETNNAKGYHYLGMAMILYGTPSIAPGTRFRTHFWKFFKEMNHRRRITSKLMRHPDSLSGFFKSVEARKPYSCASCHTR